MDKLRNLFVAFFVMMATLILSGCSAYFDEDGLSISPEELSEEEIRGCYFNVDHHTRSKSQNETKLYYVECIRECFEDSVFFYFNTTVYTDSTYSKVDWTHSPVTNDEVKYMRVFHPAKQGSFLYNIQIGDYSFNYTFAKNNGHKSILSEYGELLLSDDVDQVGDSVCVDFWR